MDLDLVGLSGCRWRENAGTDAEARHFGLVLPHADLVGSEDLDSIGRGIGPGRPGAEPTPPCGPASILRTMTSAAELRVTVRPGLRLTVARAARHRYRRTRSLPPPRAERCCSGRTESGERRARSGLFRRRPSARCPAGRPACSSRSRRNAPRRPTLPLRLAFQRDRARPRRAPPRSGSRSQSSPYSFNSRSRDFVTPSSSDRRRIARCRRTRTAPGVRPSRRPISSELSSCS